jgi:probable rRNA maturation factor
MKRLKVVLAFVNNKKMRKLNKQYRKIDEPTDVLSFPYNEDLPDGTYFLGEVVVNVDQIKNEGELIEKFVHGLKNLLREKNC